MRHNLYRRRSRARRWIVPLGLIVLLTWWLTGRIHQSTPVASATHQTEDTPIVFDGRWRWLDDVLSADGSGAATVASGSIVRSLRMRFTEPQLLHPVAPGRALYVRERQLLGAEPLVVVEHANALWSVYSIPSRVDTIQTTGTAISFTTGSVDLVFWDAVAREYISPRRILPPRSFGPRMRVPEIALIQDERVYSPSQAGIPAGPTGVALRLPEALAVDGPAHITIRRGTERVGSFDFGVGPQGEALESVGSFLLPVGRSVLELHSVGYDGGTSLIRVPVSAVAPVVPVVPTDDAPATGPVSVGPVSVGP